jgi:predicted short-subunit dehydrogenase-like oxidoreductase (DUF2520 family)
MLKTINFIGCGRVGKVIATLLSKHQLAHIGGIVTSSLATSLASVEFIGEGSAYTAIKELPPADIYFITTPDDIIESISNQLVNENILKREAIVVHCSGSLSSAVLVKAKSVACYIASLHPLKSFADPGMSVNNFAGTYCAIEGDVEATSLLTALFEKIGALVFDVKKENKGLYHAAGVIANNYLVTLHYHAVLCYQAAGVNENVAKKIVSMLMNDALKNVDELNYETALTGPIQRGDIHTIMNHLAALNNKPLIRDIYNQLGVGTLPLTTHTPEKKHALESIFKSDSK